MYCVLSLARYIWVYWDHPGRCFIYRIMHSGQREIGLNRTSRRVYKIRPGKAPASEASCCDLYLVPIGEAGGRGRRGREAASSVRFTAECFTDEAEMGALITASSCPSPLTISRRRRRHISVSSMCLSPCLAFPQQVWVSGCTHVPLSSLQSPVSQRDRFSGDHPPSHSSMTFRLMSPSVRCWGK